MNFILECEFGTSLVTTLALGLGLGHDLEGFSVNLTATLLGRDSDDDTFADIFAGAAIMVRTRGQQPIVAVKTTPLEKVTSSGLATGLGKFEPTSPTRSVILVTEKSTIFHHNMSIVYLALLESYCALR